MSLTESCWRMPQGRAGRARWPGWCRGPRAWAGSSWAAPASPWSSSPGDGWSSPARHDRLCLQTKQVELTSILGSVSQPDEVCFKLERELEWELTRELERVILNLKDEEGLLCARQTLWLLELLLEPKMAGQSLLYIYLLCPPSPGPQPLSSCTSWPPRSTSCHHQDAIVSTDFKLLPPALKSIIQF